MMTTIDDLTQVFRVVFDDPGITLQPEMTADDVEGWDSLSHVALIMSVENHFDIRFSQKEMYSFKNVGDLAKAVEKKLQPSNS
jgi:acyl carrier protein